VHPEPARDFIVLRGGMVGNGGMGCSMDGDVMIGGRSTWTCDRRVALLRSAEWLPGREVDDDFAT
jgi:hypothetical protein